MRYLLLLVLAALSFPPSSEAQRSRRVPAGVQILRHGQGIHGVGSPDGTHFAYWGRRGFEIYDLGTQRRTRVDQTQLGSITCASIGWSTDGHKVAFTHEHGIGEYDLVTGTLRAVYTNVEDPYNRTVFCAVAYDQDDRLAWTRHHRNGTALFREGREATPFPPGFAADRWAVLAFGPTSGATSLLVANRDSHLATRLDLTRHGEFEPVRDGPFPNPYADRAGRRLCFTSSAGLRCKDLRTGAIATLGPGTILGTMEANPFSPSGDRIVFNRDWSLVMHDFTTGRQHVVARTLTLAGGSLAYRGAAFADESRVLLFEHGQERGRAGPAVLRIDTTNGASQVLLRDEQQHCYAEAVGPDTIFVFRTNAGGGEDLTRVHFPSARP